MTDAEKNIPRLTMTGISKSFAATVALDSVDLSVKAGEVHALVGENGAGKSTLMKVLSGAVEPDAGSMQLDRVPYRPRSPLEARGAGISMIYQELSLAPHLSVEDNIMLGMESTRLGLIKKSQGRQKVLEALRTLDHPEISPTAIVSGLSVAAKQIVEIARALAIGCRVLVLDEPTSSLTQKDVERLFSMIEHLKNQGQAIVYISHFLEEVKKISDRFTVLRDGKVAGEGITKDATTDQIVGLMVGRKIEHLYTKDKRSPGEVVLSINELAGALKPETASLDLHRGEVLGIAGLVGAGRTELLRVLFGLEKVRRGEIKVAAYAGPGSPAHRWAQGMGLLSENRKEEGLAVAMTIADNTTLSKLTGMGPLGFVFPKRQGEAAQRRIKELDIRCRSPHQKVMELSGGNQQKVALARLLHHDVDILLLDEPTRGIDVASKAQIYELINRLTSVDEKSGRQPKAILMVSSYLPELLGICDRIAVMARGRLGPAHPAEELDEQKLMREATEVRA